ncbi:MAG: hypothetical protein ACO1OC_05150, partial [Tuberibacillus sp.]
KPLFYEAFAEAVHHKIHDVLASENPTFLDQAAELWGHFILSIFPIALEQGSADAWAATCYIMVHQLYGQTVSESFITEEFAVRFGEIEKLLRQMEWVEKPTE